MPSPCMPSRRVVSYRWICLLTWYRFLSKKRTLRVSGAARAALRPRRGGNSLSLALELDEVEPFEVLVALALDRIEEPALDRLRELAGRSQDVVVDLPHGDDLGRGAGQEDLVGLVQLSAGDVALLDLEAEVGRDLHHRARRDAVENAGSRGRGRDAPVAHDEDVLPRALRHVAVLVQQDRLVVAGLRRFHLRQDRVQVLPARLRLGDE